MLNEPITVTDQDQESITYHDIFELCSELMHAEYDDRFILENGNEIIVHENGMYEIEQN